MAATDTTRSSSATLNTLTPMVLRAAILTSSTGQRISWPPSVTMMISASSATGKQAVIARFFSPMSMVQMPLPPRPVTR